jgi:hypothetical protein
MLAAFPPTKQITPYLILDHNNKGFNWRTLFIILRKYKNAERTLRALLSSDGT